MNKASTLCGLVLGAVLLLAGGCASDGGNSSGSYPDGSIATDNNTPFNTAPSPNEPRGPDLESGSWDFGSR